jgi:hypothetical protein
MDKEFPMFDVQPPQCSSLVTASAQMHGTQFPFQQKHAMQQASIIGNMYRFGETPAFSTYSFAAHQNSRCSACKAQ